MENSKQTNDAFFYGTEFISKHFLIFSELTFLFMFVLFPVKTKAQRLSRDLNVDLLVNQVGYVPDAGKAVVARGLVEAEFEVIDLTTQQVVYTGNFTPYNCDFGDYAVGNFSDLRNEGAFYIKSDTLRSYPFRISEAIYQFPMELIVEYFSLQRCGGSNTGYLSPCHLDDGIRMDNGKHQDVSGGWHDASDLRKWVGATIYGMIGLSKTYELLGEGHADRKKVLDELMWGNKYFLKMQEPEGYVMNYVGGDVEKHSDSNRWTDNKIGEEGGELKFVKPTAGKSPHDMLIFGTNDDRVIRTDPADMVAQYNFITSEAIMTRITNPVDSPYSRKCLQAAMKCFDWCLQKDIEPTTDIIGASLQAAVEMYKTTREKRYKYFATEQALQLSRLQVERETGEIVSGFFQTSFTDPEPKKQISRGPLEFISLCDLIKAFPAHQDVGLWKRMVRKYSADYLSFMTQRNSFGIVPYSLYTGEDPGGNRKLGRYWYRYFMQPELSWWVGINANIASTGVGLMKASEILKDPHLKFLAQKQLDWIIGVNPFNSSTLVGVGYNHPKHFGGSSFSPLTPVLPGAVLNGLGGDKSDLPVIGTGNWQISEYWTPMVAYTLWLMAEISTAN